ncbi:MAG: PhnD/SsuA/transferrin family substrate-binding protein [Methylophilaceae bacterium]|nr:PhnD/SsuA/transferrin family substrate-binding protein [Methylophilaceae bacterium]
MSYNFTVSPDFMPSYISGWYIFNTWIQRQLNEKIHLELYDSFEAQREAIESGKVDLIYANPFDAAMLIRDKGFQVVACPNATSDEAVIAVSAESSILSIEDLKHGTRIASTDAPDVHMMGMIMIEPADLDRDNTTRHICSSYVLVAKDLITDKADIGFFLKDAFEHFSETTRKNLRVLVSSHIHIIHHQLMIGPRLAHLREPLLNHLLEAKDAQAEEVLVSLGFKTWAKVDHEEAEFMIDLMDTLVK